MRRIGSRTRVKAPGRSRDGSYVIPRHKSRSKVSTDTLWLQTATAHEDKKAGLSGKIVGGKKNGQSFASRNDWDKKHGFHVNAMLGSERKLYCQNQVMEFYTELQAIQRYDTLTEKIARLGDEEAAQWFMAVED